MNQYYIELCVQWRNSFVELGPYNPHTMELDRRLKIEEERIKKANPWNNQYDD
jgi:ribosomal protein S16